MTTAESPMARTLQPASAEDVESPEKSIVNMSDALDAGSAIAKQHGMRKIQERMKTLTRTVYQPDKDPQFFLFLNRLADAEEFKKTDRIDGRRALNDFIVDKASLMHVRGVKKAEQVKKLHQEQLKASKFLQNFRKRALISLLIFIVSNRKVANIIYLFVYYRGLMAARDRR